jgi:phenylalanyl-tRNA synthetase beta chain
LLDLSPFQPVERDFAFVVDNTVKTTDIVRAAQARGQEAREQRRCLRCAEGKDIDPGRNR